MLIFHNFVNGIFRINNFLYLIIYTTNNLSFCFRNTKEYDVMLDCNSSDGIQENEGNNIS